MHLEGHAGDGVDRVDHQHQGLHDLRAGEEDCEGRGEAGAVAGAGGQGGEGEGARFARGAHHQLRAGRRKVCQVLHEVLHHRSGQGGGGEGLERLSGVDGGGVGGTEVLEGESEEAERPEDLPGGWGFALYIFN